MTKQEVDEEIRAALNVWSNVTQLEFVQKSTGPVHIDVRFEDGAHSDGDPFDGSGGTLAHAYFPVYGGDAHFDNAEDWTTGTSRGTNLRQTAGGYLHSHGAFSKGDTLPFSAHEFGHSLGLSHSDSFSALMAPFYRGFQSRITLERDDVVAVQALYGEANTAVQGNEITEREDNILCSSPGIDSIISTQDGDSYVFKGENFWKLTDDSIAPGYPKRIVDVWEGLPGLIIITNPRAQEILLILGEIDASFTWKNGKTYFFHDEKYWRFSNGEPDPGYPKLISKGFVGIPNKVDAVFVWSGNEKIYFFKGSKYWKFDPDRRPPVDKAYPRPIENWEGIPNDIDDALQYDNGFTYFFKGGQYYRFDDMKFKVDTEADRGQTLF